MTSSLHSLSDLVLETAWSLLFSSSALNHDDRRQHHNVIISREISATAVYSSLGKRYMMNVLPSLTFLARVRLGENDHTRCVAMQEIAPSDRANLALSKESCRRDRAEPLLHRSDIVMGSAKESLPTPATTKQKGSERRTSVGRSIRSQE